MTKFLSIFAAVLLALSLGTPAAFAENGHGKESLVALGDLIPFGYNLGQTNESPAKVAFPFLIGEDADLRVRNLGVPGWQTQDLLVALETNKKLRRAVHHAEYVTLNIGSNDFLEILRTANAESGGNPELLRKLIEQKLATSDAFDNLSDIIREISSLTDAPIVLFNIYNPFQLNDPFHHVADQYLPYINAIYAETAHAYYNVEAADAYSAFGDNQDEYVIPQDVHPTVAGQEVLAEIGLEAFCLETVKH